MQRLCTNVAILAGLAAFPLGCHQDETTEVGGGSPDQELIDGALSAAPPSVAKDASVVVMEEDGSIKTLRQGTSGIRCFPDNPDSMGNNPMCVDEQGFRWMTSLMHGDARPGNTEPGFGYMLQGAREAKGPFEKATEEDPVAPPHVAVLWPFDAEATGLSTESSETNPWIMWAGTPYAHLMIPMGVAEEDFEEESVKIVNSWLPPPLR